MEDIVRTKSEVDIIFREIDDTFSSIVVSEVYLEKKYAKLGRLLNEVNEKGYWKGIYKSFNDYILHLSEQYKRSRTQLYHYFSTVKHLKPYFDEHQLDELGISKAVELKKAVRRLGTLPPHQIVQEISRPEVTVKETRKLLYGSLHIPENDKSVWVDMEGFYASEEEAKTIRAAFRAAERTDPALQQDISPVTRRKEIIYRLAVEYLNSHPEECSA